VAYAFRLRGHDAWSCDLERGGMNYEFHIRGDVFHQIRPLIRGVPWDLVIAHPPCTRLCNSGVRWLAERNLWSAREEGAAFFNLFKGSAPKVCIENPIPHGYARKLIGKPTQIIQPWQFWAGPPGAGESKATCLWLEGLPKLIPTTPDEPGRHQARWRMGPSSERTRERSRTYWGIAQAMAAQWG
jgi:hypothetical protein